MENELPHRSYRVTAPATFNVARPEETTTSIVQTFNRVDDAAAPLFAWKLWLVASMWALKQRLMLSTVDTTRVPTEGESTLLALARKTAAKPWFDHLAALMHSTNTGATLQQYRPLACCVVRHMLELTSIPEDAWLQDFNFADDTKLAAFVLACENSQLYTCEQFRAFHAKQKRAAKPVGKTKTTPDERPLPLRREERRADTKRMNFRVGEVCFSNCFDDELSFYQGRVEGVNQHGSVLVEWDFATPGSSRKTWVSSKRLCRELPAGETLILPPPEEREGMIEAATGLAPPVVTTPTTTRAQHVATNKRLFEAVAFVWGCGGTLDDFETKKGALSAPFRCRVATTISQIENYTVRGRRRELFPSQREKPHIRAFVALVCVKLFPVLSERLSHVPLLLIIFHFVVACSACNHKGLNGIHLLNRLTKKEILRRFATYAGAHGEFRALQETSSYGGFMDVPQECEFGRLGENGEYGQDHVNCPYRYPGEPTRTARLERRWGGLKKPLSLVQFQHRLQATTKISRGDGSKKKSVYADTLTLGGPLYSIITTHAFQMIGVLEDAEAVRLTTPVRKSAEASKGMGSYNFFAQYLGLDFDEANQYMVHLANANEQKPTAVPKPSVERFEMTACKIFITMKHGDFHALTAESKTMNEISALTLPRPSKKKKNGSAVETMVEDLNMTFTKKLNRNQFMRKKIPSVDRLRVQRLQGLDGRVDQTAINKLEKEYMQHCKNSFREWKERMLSIPAESARQWTMGAHINETSAVYWKAPEPYEVQLVIKRDLDKQEHGSVTVDRARAFVEEHEETLFIAETENVCPMDPTFGIVAINHTDKPAWIKWKTELLECLKEAGLILFTGKEDGTYKPDDRGNTQRSHGFPSTHRNATKLTELELKKSGFLTITVEEDNLQLLNVMAKLTELASRWTRDIMGQESFPEEHDIFTQYSRKLGDHFNITLCLFHAVTLAIIEESEYVRFHLDKYNAFVEGLRDTVLISTVIQIGVRFVRVTFIGYARKSVTVEHQVVADGSAQLRNKFCAREVSVAGTKLSDRNQNKSTTTRPKK